MSSENFQLNLIKVNECLGINFYSGAIRLSDLFENYDIPVYRTGKNVTAKDGGYQREAKTTRIYDVKKRVMEPLPGQKAPNTEAFVDNINLNIRAEGAEESNLKPLNPKETGYGDIFIFSYINKLGKFFGVDGQTRLRGAHDAYRDALANKDYDLAAELEDTRLQFTLTFCEDRYKEAYIFYLINQYAKKIPTEGAIRLLYEGQKNNDIHFVNEITRARKDDDVEVMEVVQKLSEKSAVWEGNIADFNEATKKKIAINVLARLIKPLHKIIKDNAEFKSLKAWEVTYKVVEAYWSGFMDAYPEMFEINNDTKFNALKTGSAEIMMMFLCRIYEYNILGQINVGQMTDKKVFEKLLKKTLDNFKDMNKTDTAELSGTDLFLVGKGSMGKYGNADGKKECVKKITKEFFKQHGIPVT